MKKVIVIILMVAFMFAVSTVSFAATAPYKGNCINYFDCDESVTKLKGHTYIGVLSTSCRYPSYNGTHGTDYGYRLYLGGKLQSAGTKYDRYDHCSAMNSEATGEVTLAIYAPSTVRIYAIGQIYAGVTDYTS